MTYRDGARTAHAFSLEALAAVDFKKIEKSTR